MDLSIREAATLLGRSARTLRGQAARGDVPAHKRGGAWVLRSDTLPLTAPQRRGLQARAEAIRNAVDDVLPSRAARTSGQRRRSVADLDAFRHADAVLRTLRTGERGTTPDGGAAAELEAALLDIGEAVHEYDRDAKVVLLLRARGRLARAVTHLLLTSPQPWSDAVLLPVQALEGEAIPALSGLLRWAERLPGRAPGTRGSR